MSKKVKIFFGSFLILAFFFTTEILYLYLSQSSDTKYIESKKAFTALVGLPDFSLSNEPYIRHRSISTVFSIYSIDGSLREYAKESYILSVKRSSQ